MELLREKGMEPYPAQSGTRLAIAEVLKKFGALVKSKRKVAVAGRIMAKREHGGSAFIDIRDGTGEVQAYFKKDIFESYEATPHKIMRRRLVNVEPSNINNYALFLETVDIGDFLKVEGKCFKTKKGEETIEVSGWKMLVKSLRPLPEKWHGLQDVEERFRKRYLDLLMNEGVRERFELRARIIKELRAFHEKNGFLEVETPMLHPVPGGALAKPFVTHHNALDLDLYLRIAPELYLKRLLIGAWEKVYEIGKSFRNEGIDAEHNPEFTELECYAAYWDENDMIDFVENLFIYLSKNFAKKGFELEGKKISFKKPFPRMDFKELLKRYALITDYDSETRDSIATRARQLGLDITPYETKGKIADEIYKKICRPYLAQPTFVINHPLDISPLAKSQGPTLTEKGRAPTARRFQLIVGGMELANGFAELNDPIDQRKRFEEQEKERSGGEEEAHRIDEDYLEAMEYGMPPAAGLGVGIDRLVMLFTDAKNIREVVLFPTMRPK